MSCEAGLQRRHIGDEDMLLAVRDLKTYFFTAAGTIRAVDGVSYDVRAGETVALVGESGCGKSVSALSIMRLVAAPAGRIVGGEIRFRQQNLLTLDEEAMRRIRGRDIAMIFQEPMTSLNPVLSIGRQLTEPLEIHLGMPSEAARQRAAELLTLVGIPDAAPTRPVSPPLQRWYAAATHDRHGPGLQPVSDPGG